VLYIESRDSELPPYQVHCNGNCYEFEELSRCSGYRNKYVDITYGQQTATALRLAHIQSRTPKGLADPATKSTMREAGIICKEQLEAQR
jgi:hypothetical protein